MEFKRIIVLQEDYLVSEERIEEMKVHINEISEETKSSKISRVYSENLKGHLESILGNIEDIYVVSGFSDLQDQIDLMIIINDLFGSYKVRVFNTLFGGDKKTDFSFCQSNIEKFLEYIA
jgi:hypothetical protein